MGVLNPVYQALTFLNDALTAVLPDLACVVVWGVLSGSAAMALYALLSNQPRIRATKRELRDIRLELKAEGEAGGSEVMTVALKNLRVSFRLLGQVIGPGTVSGLPVLLVAWWMSWAYGYDHPAAGEYLEIVASPAGATLRIDDPKADETGEGILRAPWQSGRSDIAIWSSKDLIYTLKPSQKAVREVSTFNWWNHLLVDPQGYLAEGSSITRLRFDVEHRLLIPGAPDYLATWEVAYFAALVLWSLLLKFGLRIE